MRRGTARRVGLLLLVGALGCDGAADGADDASVSPVREGSVTLEIGRLDGPIEYTFGRVSGVAMDDAERVYVADLQAHTIRVFDAEGGYVRSVGAEGQGPGELIEPCCVGIDRDRLWVRDSGNHRLSAYRLEGDGASYEVSHPMGHNSYGLWTPTFSQGDVVYDAGSVVGPPSTLALFAVGLDDRPRAVVSVRSLDPDEFGGGQVVETRRGDIVGRGYFFTPFGPRQLIAFGPAGAAAEAISSMYDVAWWGLAGDTLRIGDGRTEGPRLTDDEQALGEERLGRTRESVRQQGGTFRLTLPSHKPPLANLYFDRDGRLWVELSVSEDAPREADVYDSGGVLVERRRWPERVRIANPGWIRGDVALGVTVDSLGVQRVVRVEW